MTENSEIEAGGMALDLWLLKIGRERTTGYRWVELGMLSPLNIMGRLYLTTAEIHRFWERATAGEFSKIPTGVCKPGPKDQKAAVPHSDIARKRSRQTPDK
jgi:hypothetical protein